MPIVNGVIIIIVYIEDGFFNNLYQNKIKRLLKNKPNKIRLPQKFILFVYHLISRLNGFSL